MYLSLVALLCGPQVGLVALVLALIAVALERNKGPALIAIGTAILCSVLSVALHLFVFLMPSNSASNLFSPKP